ncbi:MAG: hypothetical protein JXB88_10290 [Spirochaetales bacterium]|nr:hypothetical protein [Spirochaetales bacterium]
MGIPESLFEIIKNALEYIEKNPQHHLVLGYRQKIWSQFGPKLNPDIPESKKAHKKRAYLALQTFKKVIPFWEEKWPRDKLALNIFLEIEQFLDGKIQIKEFRIQDLMTEIDNKGVVDGSEYFELLTGYCGVAAMQTAIFDEDFDEHNIDVLQKEPFDFFDQDTAFLAEKVYSKGETDNTARKEFWEWYLNSAVISAWNYKEK